MGREIVHNNTNGLCVSIVNVDQFAHALGEVLVGAPIGDLHPPPWLMRVQENEKIDGAIAAIFTIVAQGLHRLCRNGVPHLANQLDRAFVKADNRPLRVWGFGIQVQDVFHSGDIFPVDLGMHHMSFRHGLR